MDRMQQKLKFVKEFLNDEKIVAFIEEDDLDNVFRCLIHETGIDVYYLTRYLLSLDIDPLEFMTTIPHEMFSRVYRDNTDPVVINIPQTIKTIGDYAFYKCSSIVQVKIPASVREIGFGAFVGCTALELVDIKNGNITFDEMVFENCPNVIVRVPKGAKCIKYLQESKVKYVEL